MREKSIVTTLRILVLLPALAGCSAETPTQPGPGPSLSGAATGSRPDFVFPGGCCYYNGTVVRTVVPPAKAPNEGRDNFYAITNGVTAQKGVVAVVPGDAGYHGGDWKFHAVTFTVAPYLLTSEAAVLAAAAAGDVTITRDPAADFRCPIQS
jgi:hypothetical protein